MSALIRLEAPDRPPSSFEAGVLDSLLVAAQRSGARLRHDCGGKALCGTCRVRVLDGRLGPVSAREAARLSETGQSLDGSVRLACQARALSDARLVALEPLKPAGNP
ncbi:MAG TPA: 2Fe-2S iron-sulfur cluster-binding protein [Spirochaetales bacterium]|nr:(2Fe-2S)-binding protein [Spirochaetales bacterium]MBP7263609.1 (2Fe-2S)-binding protein [Spirochaetia bacterium]HPE36870.1 2Fe-2S iron-sulfur cluster-binding protein [Spirochaetales bacterium]